MPTIISEGEANWSSGWINYPEITSCLSVTCILPGKLVGGHCVRVPGRGQLSPRGVFEAMKRLVGKSTVQYVYFVGEISLWPWQDKEPFVTAFNLVDAQTGQDTARFIQVDTAPWGKNGRSVAVNFLPCKLVTVVQEPHVVYQRPFGQK